MKLLVRPLVSSGVGLTLMTSPLLRSSRSESTVWITPVYAVRKRVQTLKTLQTTCGDPASATDYGMTYSVTIPLASAYFTPSGLILALRF